MPRRKTVKRRNTKRRTLKRYRKRGGGTVKGALESAVGFFISPYKDPKYTNVTDNLTFPNLFNNRKIMYMFPEPYYKLGNDNFLYKEGKKIDNIQDEINSIKDMENTVRDSELSKQDKYDRELETVPYVCKNYGDYTSKIKIKTIGTGEKIYYIKFIKGGVNDYY